MAKPTFATSELWRDVHLDTSVAAALDRVAQATITLDIRIRDQDRFRLFLWELTELWFRMRLVNDPFAAELERIVERLTRGGDDDHEA